MQYGKCTRCDAITEYEDISEFGMCPAPMGVRTGGICGGSFVRITKKEYTKLLNLIKLKQVFNTDIFKNIV